MDILYFYVGIIFYIQHGEEISPTIVDDKFNKLLVIIFCTAFWPLILIGDIYYLLPEKKDKE